MAARGELPELEEEPEAEPETTSGGGFLGRIFPPAPPLPGRPDPLKGFERSGPLGFIRERIFLLRASPLVWIGLGVVAFFGFVASQFWRGTFLELLGTFTLFGAFIAAGWFGWQRPTLYGTAAGILGYVLAVGFILVSFAASGVPPDTFGTAGAVISQVVIQGAYLGALGFLGGWYGGYLRRRQTQLSAQTNRRRR